MRSEHLSNVHPGWVALGWVVAVSVTAALHLGLVATGFVPAGAPEAAVNGLALLLGFFAGGLFVGMRWSDAPVLNGAAIALLSAVLWFVTAAVSTGEISAHLGRVGTAVTLGSLLLQLGAAVAGGLTGRSMALRGQVPEPDSIPPEA